MLCIYTESDWQTVAVCVCVLLLMRDCVCVCVCVSLSDVFVSASREYGLDWIQRNVLFLNSQTAIHMHRHMLLKDVYGACMLYAIPCTYTYRHWRTCTQLNTLHMITHNFTIYLFSLVEFSSHAFFFYFFPFFSRIYDMWAGVCVCVWVCVYEMKSEILVQNFAHSIPLNQHSLCDRYEWSKVPTHAHTHTRVREHPAAFGINYRQSDVKRRKLFVFTVFVEEINK